MTDATHQYILANFFVLRFIVLILIVE